MHFIIVNIKKYIISFIFLLFMISLITFSNNNLIAAKNGLILWTNSIVPTLFPFFVATELLCKTNLIKIIGKYLHKYMKPIFNVPGESAVALILGIISGYPIGAKIVCNLYEQKICSKPEAERLLAYTNNSGPIFILSAVGITLYHNKKIGIILFITHIISSLIVGFFFRFWKKDHIDINYRTYNSNYSKEIKLSNLGAILGDAIKISIINTLMIGGFIIIFSIIISILSSLKIFFLLSTILSIFNVPKDFSCSLFTGLLELTNGVQISSQLYLNSPKLSLILTSFLIGFGGFSILLQVFSIISKYNLSIKSYLYGKILQGLLSGLIILYFI